MHDQPTAKACSKCGATKPLTEYHRDRQKADGHAPRCKACVKAKSEAWYAANRDRSRASAQEWYEDNTARAAERGRRYREANPERIRESKRRDRARMKAERPLEFSVRKRFEVRHLSVDKAAVDYGVVLLGDPCSYCGGPAGQIDHIHATSTGGDNDWTNLTAACLRCNTTKRDRPLLHALLNMETT